jgi:hypothetical protein
LAEKEYLIHLGERARKRHYHKTDKGQVVTFMVQLEVEVEKGVWRPVIRYDCAHNFAHCDRYNVKDEHDKEEIPLSYTDSLDFADKDINANWDIYQERFLRGDFP